MATTTSTIGTGKDYTTIQAWEDARNNTDQNTGYCEAEVFAAVLFSGLTYTATNYPHLTAKLGAEHDGRANEVSAKGNARIESTADSIIINIQDEFIRISWLEVKGPGNLNRHAVSVSVVSTCTICIHHCIIHNNLANANPYGINVNDADVASDVYRNMVYGYAYGVVYLAAANNSVIHCNTLYSHAAAGEYTGNAATVISNNAAFANASKDFYDITGVMDYNASSDGTADDEGANSIANLTTANQFVNPTTTWAQTDLLHKLGAGIIGEGLDLSAQKATYPEIDVSIRNGATRATITGAWDIGADQYEAAAAVGHPAVRRFGGVEFCGNHKNQGMRVW